MLGLNAVNTENMGRKAWHGLKGKHAVLHYYRHLINTLCCQQKELEGKGKSILCTAAGEKARLGMKQRQTVEKSSQ